MPKRQRRPHARQPQVQQPTRVFTFGEPEQVLTSNIGEYLGIFPTDDGRLYKPPVSRAGLAKLLRANAHHGAIPKFKRNLLLREFIASEGCSAHTMSCAALDYMVFGEAYFLAHENFLGHVLELEHLPAINMRIKVDGGFVQLLQNGKEEEFDQDEIVHIKDYDVEQNIYGIPDYLGGLQALLLNEAATLFRRRYYSNGAHAGYIFYTNDPNLSEEDEDNLRSQISASKGVGNFRSMFVNIPGGHENAIKIIGGDFRGEGRAGEGEEHHQERHHRGLAHEPALAGIIGEQRRVRGYRENRQGVYQQRDFADLSVVRSDQ